MEMIGSCPQTGICGGCAYAHLSYEAQLREKDGQLRALLQELPSNCHYTGMRSGEKVLEYRNKMEFSFGDSRKGGPLQLGMHRKKSFYDIVSAADCRIVDADYRKIVGFAENYFAKCGTSYFHKKTHRGFLRHLLIRKGLHTGEILVDLVTTSQETPDLAPFAEGLRSLPLEGRLVSILHTVNDSLSDAVKNDRTDILYGQDYFTEELLGLRFKISPFSFFQTNSYGAEVLYETVREFAKDIRCHTMFDLYSGTGTIAQILSAVAKQVIGVEIVEEAVEAARENAAANGLDNCSFIAGDVAEVMDRLETSPELIILDPPREGIQPKAIRKILGFQAAHLIYVSCNPKNMVRDLKILTANGYEIEKITAVDEFPFTANMEAVCLLSQAQAPENHGPVRP